jgi:hypothetical protein
MVGHWSHDLKIESWRFRRIDRALASRASLRELINFRPPDIG